MLRHFSAADAEVTLEMRPDECVGEYSAAYKELGVTRFSIGIESFVPVKLAALSRPRTPERFTRPVGVSFSIDLIIGTVFDDLDLDYELKSAIDLHPDHISLYPLSVEDGSLFSKHGTKLLCSNVSRQYDLSVEILEAAGYIRYESSNFARSATSICRHNLGYWHNEDCYALGVSANSKCRTITVDRLFDIPAYILAISENAAPPAYVTELTDLEYGYETLLMGLRLSSGIDLDAVSLRLQNRCDVEALFRSVDKLQEAGMVVVRGDNVRCDGPLDFHRCLTLIGWRTLTRNGWKRIVPERLSLTSPRVVLAS